MALYTSAKFIQEYIRDIKKIVTIDDDTIINKTLRIPGPRQWENNRAFSVNIKADTADDSM